MAESKSGSRCSRCGVALDGGACLRCLLAETEEISPIGRRPFWEDPASEYLEVIGEFALLE
ncbi:MAG: hypothetical protein L0Z50_14440, partial [Verrucomicrobiales bacterium]|nr:hypothetical protein [Verrucomicrobiales bacterium]